MPNTMGKNLHLCFTKIKRPEPTFTKISSDDHNHPFSIKKHNSLYDDHFDSASKSLSQTSTSSSMFPSSSSSSTPSDGHEPEFSAVLASQRFFFSSPGRSNSIIDSTLATSSKSSTDTPMMSINDNAAAPYSESSTTTSTNLSSLVDSCKSQFPESQNSHHHQTVEDSSGTIAVPTYSPDPYLDFRRSMQEMVEARDLMDVKANWDYLHELLLCYLALNPKSIHKFIVRAFADLLLSLLSPEPENASRSRESGPEMSRQRM